MKKLVASLLTAASIFTFSAACLADAESPAVYLNGQQMTFEAAPFMENDRTLVPMRAIFEAVKSTIQWDEDTNTVIGVKEKNGETNFVTLQIGSVTAFLNSSPVTLDVPPVLVNDRTFVPLRFVVESLGEKVEWDDATQSVLITTTD